MARGRTSPLEAGPRAVAGCDQPSPAYADVTGMDNAGERPALKPAYADVAGGFDRL